MIIIHISFQIAGDRRMPLPTTILNVSVLIPSRMPWQVSLTLDILQIAKQQRLELLLSTIFWYVELPKWRQIGGEMVLAFPVNKEILSPETTNTIVEDYVPMIGPKLDATKPKNCFTFVTLLLFCHNQWAWKQWDREVDIGLNFFQNEKKNIFKKWLLDCWSIEPSRKLLRGKKNP